MKTNTLTPELLRRMDAYWRAANHRSVGQFRWLAYVPRAAGYHGGQCRGFTGVEIRRARDFLGAQAMALTAGVGALFGTML